VSLIIVNKLSCVCLVTVYKNSLVSVTILNKFARVCLVTLSKNITCVPDHCHQIVTRVSGHCLQKYQHSHWSLSPIFTCVSGHSLKNITCVPHHCHQIITCASGQCHKKYHPFSWSLSRIYHIGVWTLSPKISPVSLLTLTKFSRVWLVTVSKNINSVPGQSHQIFTCVSGQCLQK
jgi:hypothetical protein